jgi:hypothetical protein
MKFCFSTDINMTLAGRERAVCLILPSTESALCHLQFSKSVRRQSEYAMKWSVPTSTHAATNKTCARERYATLLEQGSSWLGTPRLQGPANRTPLTSA